MIQLITLIEFLSILFTISNAQCTCNQIKNQFSCMMQPNCQWKFKKCETKSCAELYYSKLCQQNKKCYFNYMNQSCSELKDCSMLNATSSNECKEQSNYCGFYNSTSKQCQSLKKKDCNLLTIESECHYTNDNYLCLWINEKCYSFDCTHLKFQRECDIYFLDCTWDIDNQQCIQATCSNKPISDCSTVVSRHQYSNFYQPCQVDYSEGLVKCRNASLSELSGITCSLNTLYYATWSENSLDNGSCQICDSYIIKILFVKLLIMIQ